MGGEGRHENLATGETVNIAARLEGLAAPNTVLISNATARLTRDAFELDDLGPQELKGIAEPINVFQVFGPQEVALDDAGNLPDGGVFLVGRDEEMGLLLRRWQQSKEGLGQVVLISGEAGIGKSSLVTTVRQQVRQEGYTCMTIRCSPYHTNSALYPVIEHIQRGLQLQPVDTPETRLDKLERGLGGYSRALEDVVPLFADLLSVPVPEGRYAALNLSPQQQRQQTQDVVVGWLLEEAERRPTLAIWEDLHWADPSTLELLGLVLEQTPTVPMLHVLTYRPTFTPPWPSRSHMTPMALNRLERPQVEALMLHVAAGKSLPIDVVEHIVTKTDGIPLYVEELTRMLLRSNLLQEEATQYTLTGPLSTVAIPDTLQDSLMARLDQLGTAKEVAQVGAVIGREFTYEMLQVVAPGTEDTLQAGLAQLVEDELLYQRGRPPRSRYMFKHALARDAAYATLLRRTRQQMHQQIAECLVERFPDISTTQPELVAQHYTEATCPEQAISYWGQAVERARLRHAYAEAIEHCTRGITLLTELPETLGHIRQEIMLQAALGALLTAVKGFAVPEAKQAYERARQRCQQLGDTTQLFPVLVGLCLYYIVNTAYRTAQELVEQLLSLAEHSADSNRLTVAHYLAAAVAFFRGEFQRAQAHATQGIDAYDTQQHAAMMAVCSQDPGVGCHLYLAQALQLLGYADQAKQQAQTALDLAHTLNHPFTYGYTQLIVMRLCRIRYDWERLIAMADTLIDYADEHGFGQFPANCLIYKGYALAKQGHIQEGAALLQQRNARVHRFRAGGQSGYGRMDMCEMDAMLGQRQQAIKELDNLLIEAEQSGGEFPVAEFHRLKGDLFLQLEGDYHAQAEASFHQAINIARQQQAKFWELRATTSLARLWQSLGKRRQAYDLLQPVYGWFTEGFDTADLKDAKDLLAELT
jgi:predicted ATPase